MLRSMQNVGQTLSAMVFGTSSRRDLDSKPDINTLPPEMLHEIFQWIMTPPDDDDKEMDPESDDTYNTPVLCASLPITPIPLTQVCRRWRYIAQNKPYLWSSISIGRPSKRILHSLKLWMQFAKRGPLYIEFHQPEPKSSEELEAAVEIIDLLCSRYQQWSEVKLWLDKDFFPPSLAGCLQLIPAIPSPVLKILHMTNSSGYRPTSTAQAVAEVWDSLNKIQSLKTLNYQMSSTLSRPSAFWLQNLNIKFITVRDLIEGVKICVNLLSVEALFIGSSPDDYTETELQSMTPFEHSHLHGFYLTGKSRYIQTFIRSFTLPCLDEVEMYTRGNNPILEHLHRLICRSQAFLVRLILQLPVDGETIFNWISAPYLCRLQCLAIDLADITNKTLLKFTVLPVSEPEANSFPDLMYLILSCCTEDIDEDILLRMAASRLFTALDQLPKVELKTFIIRVKNKTSAMRNYETMCQELIAAAQSPTKPWLVQDSNSWKDRAVEIEQQP